MKTVTYSGFDGGNDFAVDDISLGCLTTDNVTVCVCSPTPPPYIATIKIPVRHSVVYSKFDQTPARECNARKGSLHIHHPFQNICDSWGGLYSGYVNGDNNLPSFHAFSLDFHMTPYNWSNTSAYLALPEHSLTIFKPCFKEDILSAKLSLSHMAPPYCSPTTAPWPRHISSITQPHMGNNGFTVQRVSQNITQGCYSGSISPMPNSHITFDNLPPTANNAINLGATLNAYQDFSIDVTQMLKNALVPDANYIGFQVKQLQYTTFNNVYFEGIINPNGVVEAREPYIELTYWRYPIDQSCIDYRTNYQIKTNQKAEFPSSFSDADNEIRKDENYFNLFPNPANSIVTLKSEYQILHIEIYNSLNQRVKSINPTNSKVTSISISDLNTGIYNCTITTKKGIENKKLVIQR
jgi:hypothetical protein